MKTVLYVFAVLFSLSAQAQVSVMGGVAIFKPPQSGIYWVDTLPHDNFMTPTAGGLRWDSGKSSDFSVAVQYTYFGTVKMNSEAYTKEWPDPAGYDYRTGECGTVSCDTVPRRRWKMWSTVQSIAVFATRHFDKWSIEAGVNMYEIKTGGGIFELNGDLAAPYREARCLDFGPAYGLAYADGPWAVRLQVWRMEGRGDNSNGCNTTPGAFKEDAQTTFMFGYSF